MPRGQVVAWQEVEGHPDQAVVPGIGVGLQVEGLVGGGDPDIALAGAEQQRAVVGGVVDVLGRMRHGGGRLMPKAAQPRDDIGHAVMEVDLHGLLLRVGRLAPPRLGRSGRRRLRFSSGP